MSRRWKVLGIAVLAMLAAATAFLSPRRSDSGPDGTLALRRFYAGMGLEGAEEDWPVHVGDTFILIRDLRDSKQDGALLDLVGRGLRLVVADPGSGLALRLGVSSAGPAGLDSGLTTLHPHCAEPEGAGVPRVVVDRRDSLLAGPKSSSSCFPSHGRAFEVIVPYGKGTVVFLGGPSPLTNRLLGRKGNAAFACRLAQGARQDRPVWMGPAIPTIDPSYAKARGLWDSLPEPFRVGIIELCIALVLFALARGRRMGKPVQEAPISPIPASELVRATANLYRQARAAGFAGGILRRVSSGRLARAGAHSSQAERLRSALEGPDVTDDQGLLDLARELELAGQEAEPRR